MGRSLSVLLTVVLVAGGLSVPIVPAEASTPTAPPPTAAGALRSLSASRVARELRSQRRENGLRFTAEGRVANATGSTGGPASTAEPSKSPRITHAGVVRTLAAPGSTKLTFDDVDTGTIITDQYADRGVVFSGPDSASPVYTASDGSDPTSPALSGTPQFSGDIHAVFVKPGTATPVTVGNFSIDVGYIDDPGSTELVVYSSSGTQILTADYTGYGTLTSTIGNVYGFVIKEVATEEAGYTADNLVFTPGTTVLSGLGGGSLSPSESYGASNPAEPLCICSTGYAGDPVNTANGGLTETVQDVAVAGHGPALDVVRTYNSLAGAGDGFFGHGWSSLLDMRVRIDQTTGDATVTQASGATVTYRPSPAGFVAPSRVSASLSGSAGDGYTFGTRDGLSYAFTGSGDLESVMDRAGYAVTIDRVSATSIEAKDSAGRRVRFTLRTGHVVQVTDPTGASLQYGYSAAGDLTTVVDRVGAVTRYAYVAHRLTSTTDANRTTTTSTYDQQGRVTRQRDARGGITRFAYTAAGATTVTSPAGRVTVDRYSHGLLASRTVGSGTPLAATTTYAYDPLSGGISRITDPRGGVSRRTYDLRGNLLTSTDAAGRKSTWTYTELDRPASMTDPLGIATIYSYDSRGDLVSVSRPLDQHTTATRTYTYGSGSTAGDLLQSTDADGRATTYTYDAAGNRLTTTNALGQTSSSTYDADGRRLSTRTATGRTTTYSYDREGRLLRTVDPLRHATAYRYDAGGRRVAITNALGRTTRFEYDRSGDLTATISPAKVRTRVIYDADGNPVRKTDAKGHSRRYTYDALGRVATATDALGKRTTYRYDRSGNLVSTRDALKRTVRRTYDAVSQLTAVDYSDPRTADVRYTYDADGRRTAMRDGTGTSQYGYDGLGRVVSERNGHGRRVGYTLDAAGNRTTTTYPNGKAVSATFDAAGRMTAVTDWLGTTTTFAYDADGRLTRTDYGGHGSVVTSYDADGQVRSTRATGATGTVVAALAYRRNALAQVVKEAGAGAVKASRTYAYDTSSRLAKDTRSPYRYDKNGDPIGFAGTTQTFDAADRLTKTVGRTTTRYTVNAVGERVRAATKTVTTTYSYDQAQHLVRVARTVRKAKRTATRTYRYDGDGLRTSVTSSGHRTDFVYDTTGTTPALLSGGSWSYVYGPDGLPIEQISSKGTAQFFFHDQSGSTRALLSSTGRVVGTISYTAYGTPMARGSARTALTFGGGYQDAGTGLLYLVNRYLDPRTGQFLTVDPLVELTNAPYRYALSDPVNTVDPDGLFINFGAALLGAAIGGIAGGVVSAASDVITGNTDHLGADVAGGVVGGALGGACIGFTLAIASVGCAAVAGAVGETTTEAITGEWDPVKIGAAGVLGGVLGGVLPSSTRGFLPTKLSNLWRPGVNAMREYHDNSVSGALSVSIINLLFGPAAC